MKSIILRRNTLGAPFLIRILALVLLSNVPVGLFPAPLDRPRLHRAQPLKGTLPPPPDAVGAGADRRDRLPRGAAGAGARGGGIVCTARPHQDGSIAGPLALAALVAAAVLTATERLRDDRRRARLLARVVEGELLGEATRRVIRDGQLHDG